MMYMCLLDYTMLEFAPRNQPGIYFMCKPSNKRSLEFQITRTLSIFRRVKWIDLQETQPDELHVSSFRIGAPKMTVAASHIGNSWCTEMRPQWCDLVQTVGEKKRRK